MKNQMRHQKKNLSKENCLTSGQMKTCAFPPNLFFVVFFVIIQLFLIQLESFFIGPLAKRIVCSFISPEAWQPTEGNFGC